jgi:hypothetical protein
MPLGFRFALISFEWLTYQTIIINFKTNFVKCQKVEHKSSQYKLEPSIFFLGKGK